MTPVLPQWDLGIVVLAMASAGRRSKLQALVFDPQYIQFKPKGAGVTLYFSPEFMRKNQRPNQVNDPWYIPAVLTGKPDIGAPNCSVRAQRYYHIYDSAPRVKGWQTPLVYSIKRQQCGKELSEASITRWICTTIVDSHAILQNSKSIPGKVKAHEVCAGPT